MIISKGFEGSGRDLTQVLL